MKVIQAIFAGTVLVCGCTIVEDPGMSANDALTAYDTYQTATSFTNQSSNLTSLAQMPQSSSASYSGAVAFAGGIENNADNTLLGIVDINVDFGASKLGTMSGEVSKLTELSNLDKPHMTKVVYGIEGGLDIENGEVIGTAVTGNLKGDLSWTDAAGNEKSASLNGTLDGNFYNIASDADAIAGNMMLNQAGDLTRDLNGEYVVQKQ